MQLPKPLNKYIDHTLLNPSATHADFESFLDDAVKYQFASVCVSPYMAAPIKAALQGEDINVGTVISFPHGNLPIECKVAEVIYFADRGIDEIDFVLNYGDLKSGLYELVGTELEVMGKICSDRGLLSKCIIETCYLTQDEITFMFTAINERTTIDYIKTSTGYGSSGAALQDVMNWNTKREAFLERYAGNLIQLVPVDGRETPVQIKAAGGIRDLETALKFIACGADRLGMSASVEVMEAWNARS